MTRPEKIDLFDLSDKILDKLNCDGKFHLTHYDFALKFRRDKNYPTDKFNIDLILFGEEISVAYYTIDYHSIEEIIRIFFVHLRDDYGYDKIEDAVISTKRASLHNRLKETFHEIDSLFALRGIEKPSIFVDEKYPDTQTDEKGLPLFELNIISEKNEIDLKIELSWISSDYNDKKRILAIMNENINGI